MYWLVQNSTSESYAGTRRKELLYELKEKKEHWSTKEEAVDRTVWKTCFGKSYGPVAKQIKRSS
jgi:hypothetical protein